MEQISFLEEKPKGNIIGLDLSLRSSGYAIIDYMTGNVLELSRIPTTSKMTDQETIIHISKKIIKLCKEYNVEYAARETTFVRFKRTAVRLSLVSGSVITTLLLISKVKRLEGYAPAQIKKLITGAGNCQKEDVAWELQKTYPFLAEEHPFSTVKKKGVRKTDDLYDALGSAVSLRMELLKKL